MHVEKEQKRQHPLLMNTINKTFLALALPFCVLAPVWAQTSSPSMAPEQASTPPVQPQFLEAKASNVPSRIKAKLPRGVQTVFCLQGQLEGKPVVLLGWKPRKSKNTTMDIWTTATTARPRGAKTRSSATPRRLQRVVLGEIESQGEISMNIETTTFDTRAKRGSVLVLRWPYYNVSFSYSYNPMIVVTLPDGLSGRAFSGNYTTMSEPGGGTSFSPSIGSDGRVFLRRSEYDSNQNTAVYTPFVWNGTTFKEGTRGPTEPDTN